MRLTKREASFWANFSISFALLVGILVVINLISSRYYFMRDMTAEKIHTLSDQTKKILAELDKKAREDGKDLQITAFMRDNDPRTGEFRALMQLYSYESRHLKWESIDPERKPQIAAAYEVNTPNTLILTYGDRKIKTQLDFGDREKTPESVITNSILKLIRLDKPRVCFVEGHGEKDPNDTEPGGFSELAEALRGEGFDVGKIRLWEEGSLSFCNVVFLAGPKTPLADAEVKELSSYLIVGGRTIFLSDPDSRDNIAQILEPWGIGMDDGIIVDPASRIIGASPAMPIIMMYDDTHPISRNFRLGVIMAVARRVYVKNRIAGVEANELAKTSDRAWVEFDWRGEGAKSVSFDSDKDVRGPVPIAVALKGIPGTKGGEVVYGTMQEAITAEARIIVFGDSDFVANGFIGNFGNMDFILNAVNWVAERGELIAIRPKERKEGTLRITENQMKWIRNIYLFILPATFLVLSMIMYIRRKRL